jgi:hypothetical protein
MRGHRSLAIPPLFLYEITVFSIKSNRRQPSSSLIVLFLPLSKVPSLAMTKFSALVKLEETLSSLSSATESEVSSFTEAYVSSSFQTFSKAQFPPVAAILTTVAEKQRDRIASVKQGVTSNATFKKDVQPLKTIYSDLQERRKKHADLTSQFNKSAKVAASADEKYEKLKSKNPASPDTRRLMNDRDIQFSKRDAIGSELETSKKSLELSERIYKKQLFEGFLNALENFAKTSKEQAEAQKEATQEIATLGISLREHKEPVPESIKAELDELRAAKFN